MIRLFGIESVLAEVGVVLVIIFVARRADDSRWRC